MDIAALLVTLQELATTWGLRVLGALAFLLARARCSRPLIALPPAGR